MCVREVGATRRTTQREGIIQRKRHLVKNRGLLKRSTLSSLHIKFSLYGGNSKGPAGHLVCAPPPSLALLRVLPGFPE